MFDQILDHFPSVRHAFAYGSGVFKQPGLYDEGPKTTTKPMVDMIFAVENAKEWHRQNLELNRRHYSMISLFGPSAIDTIAERIGAGVYFNTLVPYNEGLIKYGVVNRDTLQRDLLTWNSLYLAGRLHKPVLTLQTDRAISDASAINLESALRTALLLLPERTTLRELLRTICLLSYSGDVRMGMAEDANKVDRIVSGSFQGLIKLFDPALVAADKEWKVLSFKSNSWFSDGQASPKDMLQQDQSPEARASLLAALPSCVLEKLAAGVGRTWLKADSFSDPSIRATFARDLSSFTQLSDVLKQSVAALVRASSRRQALAGALSAGMVKSVRYTWSKIKKARKFIV